MNRNTSHGNSHSNSRSNSHGSAQGTPPYRILQCSLCPHTGDACRIGFELAQGLYRSIAAGGEMIAEDFEISGHVEMPGCTRPCTGAFHATKTACHLFGDVERGADVAALLSDPAPAAAITLEAGAARLN
ncbi:hypothetical protein [Shimia sp.]|uniref:hypothetical protein n=1 Tax=Shimia sp. TaxID=1954381 RepID=UPI0035684C80